MWARIALVLVAAILTGVPAAADDRLDAAAAALERTTAQPRTEAAAVDRMARLLRLAPDVLRAERTRTRLGWSDLFIAHRIAARGGHPVAKVFAARRTGAAWGTIAEEANVSVDALLQDVASVWPDGAVSATAPGGQPPATAAPPAAEPKGLGARIRQLLGASGEPAGDDAADRVHEDIRDQMLRGGGRPR